MAAAAYANTCALLASGNVHCWGLGFQNDYGEANPYAGTEGVNGGGAAGGIGFLLDAGGNDLYRGTGAGANGGATEACLQSTDACLFVAGAGLLLDLEGQDTYSDGVVECLDCSVVPKGVAGMQLDSDDALAG